MSTIDIPAVIKEVESLKHTLLSIPGTENLQIISPICSNKRVLFLTIVPSSSIFKGDGKVESDEFHHYLETIRDVLGKFSLIYKELGGVIFDYSFDTKLTPPNDNRELL